MDILYSKDVRSFTMLHTDFLDCEMLNSNEKILLAILMHYDSYGKNNPPTTFPSLAGLARKTGLAEKVVKTTLKSLEEKQLICKQARYRNGSRARVANFYVIQDTPLFWKSLKADSNNTSNIDTYTIQEAIELLHFAGYKVMKPVNKETSFSDVGASEKGEFVSANNVNFVDVPSISDDTSSELKSQAQISKLSNDSTEKLERYSKDFLYRHFDFESVS